MPRALIQSARRTGARRDRAGSRSWSSRIARAVIAAVVLLIAGLVSPLYAAEFSPQAADSPQPYDFAAATLTLQQSCGECHAGGAREGGFALDEFTAESSLKDMFPRWQKVRQRIAERSMPPADAEPISDAARQALTDWIESASIAAICADGPQAGPPLLRRLARYEYSNTIRDLLNVHFDAGEGLPEDAAGGEGFANAAETLTISPIHAEKYLQAATEALDYVARDEGARRRILPIAASADVSEREAARQNLARFAPRAFRRPLEPGEVERYLVIYESARAEGLSFDDAVLYAMRGILISPSFLFLAESNPAEVNVAQPLPDHELAVRLSYFLWASTPDGELRKAADAGKLNTDEELTAQVQRMISAKGTHLQDSMEQFMGNWLGTADLGRAKQLDRERFPWLTDPYVADLRNQPVLVMESILQNNDPLLDLIDAKWTFLNDELTRVYRIKKDKIKEDFAQRLVRVNLPDEYQDRGGLLGMGGVLAVSSYPRRSSPVLRGAWVLEKLLGRELPPPPPNVPALDDAQAASKVATLRDRLLQHRADAACATCHNHIDPIGFALENFDELGRWRDKDAGGPIDAIATLPTGEQLAGPAGLKAYVMSQKDTFVRVLTRKMLAYALGRGLLPSDLCTVELIVQRVREHEYRSQELVLGIVLSEPFRQKIIRERPPDEETR